jgi:hypothetical protein
VAAQTGITSHDPLFGADAPAGTRRVTNLTVSVPRGRDDDLAADQGVGVSPLQPHVGGEYSDLDLSLSLARSHPRFSISARAASGPALPGLEQFHRSNDTAAVDLTVNLGARPRFDQCSRQLLSNLALDTFPQQRRSSRQDAPARPAPGRQRLARLTRTTYGGTTELSRALGKTSSLASSSGRLWRETQRAAER